MESGVALYAAVGPTLTRYTVDIDGAALSRQEAVTLPANIHYAWPHRSGRFLYVATSDSAPGHGPVAERHYAVALAIDGRSGALRPHGDPILLPSRPIHAATDIASSHLLVAFSRPAAARVYRIHADGTLGEEVRQAEPVDPGIYPHQIRATPDGRRVVLVARGHDATAERGEEPGALLVFDYAGGQLSGERAVAPNGGFGFGPRHLDFHPTQPWVYVSLERQNALAMFTSLSSDTPHCVVATLARPSGAGARQLAGTIHVHPNRRFVYVANRSDSLAGENSFAACAIDPATGVPSVMQHIDTGGAHCRTFHIDPSGRLLVAAHIRPASREDGTMVPANLSVFRIGDDGHLAFVRAYDVDVGDATMFWMGMVSHAGR